jgi:hypothetical protein
MSPENMPLPIEPAAPTQNTGWVRDANREWQRPTDIPIPDEAVATTDPAMGESTVGWVKNATGQWEAAGQTMPPTADAVEPKYPESDESEAEIEDAMKAYFVSPEETQKYRAIDGMPPLDEAAVAEWAQNLPADTLNELQEQRDMLANREALRQAVHEKLTELVPELYQAKLPPELEARLQGIDYAIGFNQTMAASVEDAQAYLDGLGGIDVTDYNLDHRFLMYDQGMGDALGTDNGQGIAGAIEAGYYGRPEVGRFIAAFPDVTNSASEVSDRLSVAVNTDTSLLPTDEVLSVQGESRMQQVVNGKYVAGFIDDKGALWVNGQFGVSNTPTFEKYEAPVAA